MENCLGGSKRTIRAQRDLQQLKQQCQQLPPNQNFYTQQQPQVHRQVQTIKQQQQQLQQQLLQQQEQQQLQQRQQHQQQHEQRYLIEEQKLQKAVAQLHHHQQQQQQHQQHQQKEQQLIHPFQQLTLQHHRQLQQQQQQQQLEIAYQLTAESEHNRGAAVSTTPKFVANCLHFPPPPDYPPPPQKTPTATTVSTAATGATKTMSTANVKTTTTTTTATTHLENKANVIGHHHQHHQHYHQQQQQQQQQQQMSIHPYPTQQQHERHQQHLQHQQQPQHHHQIFTDNVLTHLEPSAASAAPPIVSVATHAAVNATLTPSSVSNATTTNNSHHHHHHSSASASSSPSSSSATSGTTIGVSPHGRRQVLPRYPDPDPDAIEVCNEQEPINISRMSARHNTKTLGRANELLNSDAKWSAGQQTTSLQLLHQHAHNTHPHSQHDYSYAYYEPGAAMRHSNIPPPEMVPGSAHTIALHAPPPPNSMRALLSKGMRNKLLSSPAARHAYQAQYGLDGAISCDSSTLRNAGAGATARATSENFYEEISSNEAALQYHHHNNTSHRHHHLRPTGTSHSAGSLNQSLVEEEFRRVQDRHHQILGELNLSVEAMLMPESSPSPSPTSCEAPSVSVTTASGQPNLGSVAAGGASSLRLSSTSANNICDANLSELLSTVGPTDELLSPVQSSTNAAFCAGDLDSGFSGSSGASYMGSLRVHKTNAALSHIMSTRQTHANSAAAAQASTSCNFSYGTQSCRSFQRSSSTKQPHHHLPLDDDLNSGFLTRASCGRRILNCSKIRAAEDPGPVVPTESKARSFWNRKGWRKLPGFSTSTSSINDTGVTGEPISMKNLKGDNNITTIPTTTTTDTKTRTKTKTKNTNTKAIPLICLKR